LIIAVGNSRKDKIWKNIEITWEEFLERVSNTKRTAETMAEYRKLAKNKQDELKDVGGFVGGKLREGRRKNGYVEYRSMITLDMDYADKDFWETFTILFDFTCCIYSTRKHTAEKPRLRLIIPLLRTVTAEEYAAVSRKVAEEIGIEQFDDTTFEAARLMYWSSTSSDGEFLFREQKGTLLNPDEYLKRYSDWRDGSQWPVSSRIKESVKQNIKKQADPLEKEGIIGVFCRVYSITEAIDKFLTEVYKPSISPDRYDYIPADSTAGVVLYDDKFAYSHHATDPVCGKLCNAWDLVRLHKFGDLDIDADINTPVSKLPSFLAMQEMALSDENVKKQILSERIEQAEGDFKDWRSKLSLDKSGRVKDTLDNIVLILENDNKLINIAFNLHRDGIDSKGSLPWKQVKEGWNDSDNAALKVYLSKTYGIYSPTKTKDAVVAVAASRLYHPIREYLSSLPDWDGIKRVDTLLIDYFGAEDIGYTRAVMRKTLVAAVARIYNPGTKYDSVLIINGPQGIGKSTFFAKLGGQWFSDSLTLTDMRDKSGPEKLQGYWILELGELAGMKKADIETVKSFLSRVDDKYRASYGLNVENHPRQCVIVGSTNSEAGFLRDITGNRRFWPVKVTGNSTKKPWQMADEEIRQIWAEAKVLYEKGEKLYLEGEDAVQAMMEQSDAMEADDREGLVREYLERLLPENWDEMDLFSRRNFLNGTEFGSGSKGSIRRERVCTMEIWCECFGKDAASMKKIDAYELNAIMAKIEGWKKYDGNNRGSLKFPIYGVQRAYIRKL
jgi:predicted P-loop ATPase